MARKRKATITGSQGRPTNATLLLGTLQIQGTPREVYGILGNFVGSTAGGSTTAGTATAPTTINAQTPAKRGRRKMTAAQRQALSIAAKKRWASKARGKGAAATA